MNDFEPGDGWRDVTSAELPAGVPQMVEYNAEGIVVRCWVREEPVPPLPTEPYTVIRVTWAVRGSIHPVLMLIADDWCNAHGEDFAESDLPRLITGFEVLAQPKSVLDTAAEAFAEKLKRVRTETAKAVLDRVQATQTLSDRDYSVIAGQFGVDA